MTTTSWNTHSSFIPYPLRNCFIVHNNCTHWASYYICIGFFIKKKNTYNFFRSQKTLWRKKKWGEEAQRARGQRGTDFIDKEVRKDLCVKVTFEQKSKGRDEQSIQKSGGRWLKTNRSTKALRNLSWFQGITKKSVWPEWVRERTIGDDATEHPRFNRDLRKRFKSFKYKIHTNVFFASAGVPYFPNTQAKR